LLKDLKTWKNEVLEMTPAGKTNSKPILLNRKPFRVLVCLVTLVAFISTSVFSDAAWAVTTTPMFTGRDVGAADGPGNFKELNVDTFTLPAFLGMINDQHNAGEGSKTVIHIQDAHCNYACQMRISEIIDHLAGEYGIRAVNLEGGAGEYDLSIFTRIQDPETRQKVADYFVKEGLVNGAEFFAINNPDMVDLWGVEDVDLYIANLNAYRDSLKRKDEVERHLKALKHILNNLKRHIYSPEMLEFDMKYVAYKAGNMEFREYLSWLIEESGKKGINIKELPNIYLLDQSLAQEDGVDFREANIERSKLIHELEKGLSKVELERLVAKTLEFRQERISQKDFYAHLIRCVRLIGADLEGYPALQRYMMYITMYEAIDKMKIMEELDAIESTIRDELCLTETEKELALLSKHLSLIENFFEVRLTKEDYRYYTHNEAAFHARNFKFFIDKQAPRYKIDARPDSNISDLDGYRGQLAKFYEYSFKRDEVFLENLSLGESQIPVIARERSDRSNLNKTAVIVTGGFHTENLKTLFRKQGISYISIMPNFRNCKGYESPYFGLLAGKPNATEDTVYSFLSTSTVAIASFFNRIGQLAHGEKEYIWVNTLVRLQLALARGDEGIRLVYGDRRLCLGLNKNGETELISDSEGLEEIRATEFMSSRQIIPAHTEEIGTTDVIATLEGFLDDMEKNGVGSDLIREKLTSFVRNNSAHESKTLLDNLASVLRQLRSQKSWLISESRIKLIFETICRTTNYVNTSKSIDQMLTKFLENEDMNNGYLFELIYTICNRDAVEVEHIFNVLSHHGLFVAFANVLSIFQAEGKAQYNYHYPVEIIKKIPNALTMIDKDIYFEGENLSSEKLAYLLLSDERAATFDFLKSFFGILSDYHEKQRDDGWFPADGYTIRSSQQTEWGYDRTLNLSIGQMLNDTPTGRRVSGNMAVHTVHSYELFKKALSKGYLTSAKAIKEQDPDTYNKDLGGGQTARALTEFVHFSINRVYGFSSHEEEELAFVYPLEILLENQSYSEDPLKGGTGLSDWAVGGLDANYLNNRIPTANAILLVPMKKAQEVQDFLNTLGESNIRIFAHKGNNAADGWLELKEYIKQQRVSDLVYLSKRPQPTRLSAKGYISDQLATRETVLYSTKQNIIQSVDKTDMLSKGDSLFQTERLQSMGDEISHKGTASIPLLKRLFAWAYGKSDGEARYERIWASPIEQLMTPMMILLSQNLGWLGAFSMFAGVVSVFYVLHTLDWDSSRRGIRKLRLIRPSREALKVAITELGLQVGLYLGSKVLVSAFPVGIVAVGAWMITVLNHYLVNWGWLSKGAFSGFARVMLLNAILLSAAPAPSVSADTGLVAPSPVTTEGVWGLENDWEQHIDGIVDWLKHSNEYLGKVDRAMVERSITLSNTAYFRDILSKARNILSEYGGEEFVNYPVLFLEGESSTGGTAMANTDLGLLLIPAGDLQRKIIEEGFDEAVLSIIIKILHEGVHVKNRNKDLSALEDEYYAVRDSIAIYEKIPGVDPEVVRDEKMKAHAYQSLIFQEQEEGTISRLMGLEPEDFGYVAYSNIWHQEDGSVLVELYSKVGNPDIRKTVWVGPDGKIVTDPVLRQEFEEVIYDAEVRGTPWGGEQPPAHTDDGPALIAKRTRDNYKHGPEAFDALPIWRKALIAAYSEVLDIAFWPHYFAMKMHGEQTSEQKSDRVRGTYGFFAATWAPLALSVLFTAFIAGDMTFGLAGISLALGAVLQGVLHYRWDLKALTDEERKQEEASSAIQDSSGQNVPAPIIFTTQTGHKPETVDGIIKAIDEIGTPAVEGIIKSPSAQEESQDKIIRLIGQLSEIRDVEERKKAISVLLDFYYGRYPSIVKISWTEVGDMGDRLQEAAKEELYRIGLSAADVWSYLADGGEMAYKTLALLEGVQLSEKDRKRLDEAKREIYMKDMHRGVISERAYEFFRSYSDKKDILPYFVLFLYLDYKDSSVSGDRGMPYSGTHKPKGHEEEYSSPSLEPIRVFGILYEHIKGLSDEELDFLKTNRLKKADIPEGTPLRNWAEMAARDTYKIGNFFPADGDFSNFTLFELLMDFTEKVTFDRTLMNSGNQTTDSPGETAQKYYYPQLKDMAERLGYVLASEIVDGSRPGIERLVPMDRVWGRVGGGFVHQNVNSIIFEGVMRQIVNEKNNEKRAELVRALGEKTDCLTKQQITYLAPYLLKYADEKLLHRAFVELAGKDSPAADRLIASINLAAEADMENHMALFIMDNEANLYEDAVSPQTVSRVWFEKHLEEEQIVHQGLTVAGRFNLRAKEDFIGEKLGEIKGMIRGTVQYPVTDGRGFIRLQDAVEKETLEEFIEKLLKAGASPKKEVLLPENSVEKLGLTPGMAHTVGSLAGIPGSIKDAYAVVTDEVLREPGDEDIGDEVTVTGRLGIHARTIAELGKISEKYKHHTAEITYKGRTAGISDRPGLMGLNINTKGAVVRVSSESEDLRNEITAFFRNQNERESMDDFKLVFNASDDPNDLGEIVLGLKGLNLMKALRKGRPVPAFDIIRADRKIVAEQITVDFFRRYGWIEIDGRRIRRPVSVRSSPVVSHPGMLRSVLNVGMSQELAGLLGEAGWEMYAGYLMEFGVFVLGMNKDRFLLIEGTHRERAEEYARLLKGELAARGIPIIDREGEIFPLDFDIQVRMTITSVKDYLPKGPNRAVIVQEQVFGNLNGDNSGSFVVTVHGESRHIDYVSGKQCDVIVSGRVTPQPLANANVTDIIRSQINDMISPLQDQFGENIEIEGTVEDGKVWLLQVRASAGQARPEGVSPNVFVKAGLAGEIKGRLRKLEKVENVEELTPGEPVILAFRDGDATATECLQIALGRGIPVIAVLTENGAVGSHFAAVVRQYENISYINGIGFGTLTDGNTMNVNLETGKVTETVLAKEVIREDPETGEIVLAPGKALSEKDMDKSSVVQGMMSAGEKIVPALFQNLFRGEECYDYVMGAVPVINGEKHEKLAFGSGLTKLNSASRRFVQKKRIGNINSRFTMGEDDAIKMINEVIASIKAGVEPHRINISMSETLMKGMNINADLLKSMNKGREEKHAYTSVRQFLKDHTIFNEITDKADNNVYPLSYGRLHLVGLTRLNVGHVVAMNKDSKDPNALQDALAGPLRSQAYAMALFNNDLSSAGQIEKFLKEQASNPGFYRMPYNMTLPEIARMNMQDILTTFLAEAEVLRSL
jgi:phosphotransferase system HPr-like phosphotransfer protein